MSWEHRAHRRVLTVVPALIAGEQGQAIGHLVNLSTEGCVIATAHAPVEGQHLHLLVQVPTLARPIKIQSAVVRWRALGLCGVEFVQLSAPHYDGLRHYLRSLDPEFALATRKQPAPEAEETTLPC
jgi:hypothetical protein